MECCGEFVHMWGCKCSNNEKEFLESTIEPNFIAKFKFKNRFYLVYVPILVVHILQLQFSILLTIESCKEHLLQKSRMNSIGL
jgi:hypothetical protein